jgi:hypothetical protein
MRSAKPKFIDCKEISCGFSHPPKPGRDQKRSSLLLRAFKKLPVLFVRKAALKCLTLGDFFKWRDLFFLYFGLFFVRYGNLEVRGFAYFSS